MNKVVITGTGFITSIGNSYAQVVDSLINLRHGFSEFPAEDCDRVHPSLYGSIKEFDLGALDHEDWIYPDRYSLKRSEVRSMPAHVLYAYFALRDAIAHSGLSEEEVSNFRTGLYSASAGSPEEQYRQIEIMNKRGILRCSPFSVVLSTVGTINFNLSASLEIKGATCGMASACASSAHALGFAFNEIALGRQDRMFVVGAEDGNRETILPFASMRALSFATDPQLASCPFDVARSGFVGTGGATALVLESEATAKARGAPILAEFAGWGQASDGYNPAMSHPEGVGLVEAMNSAMASSDTSRDEVEYVNAHATSTVIGDASELNALKTVFGESEVPISSTKALSGHGLSMAGAMEAAFCVAAINDGFTPGSAHINKLDDQCEGLNINHKLTDRAPSCVLSNSSGFGGANVSLVFKSWHE